MLNLHVILYNSSTHKTSKSESLACQAPAHQAALHTDERWFAQLERRTLYRGPVGGV